MQFRVNLASLFSFWVATDTCGGSNGYVGNGGPGLIERRDVKGKCGQLRECCRTILPLGVPRRGAGQCEWKTEYIRTKNCPEGLAWTSTVCCRSKPSAVLVERTPRHHGAGICPCFSLCPWADSSTDGSLIPASWGLVADRRGARGPASGPRGQTFCRQ